MRILNIETYIEKNTAINGSNAGSNLNNFVTVQEYVNETRDIWTSIEAQSVASNEHMNEVLQLKTDLGSVVSEVQNQTSRIIQFESNQATDRNLTNILSLLVTQLESDQASASNIIEVHNERILDNSNILKQLVVQGSHKS